MSAPPREPNYFEIVQSIDESRALIAATVIDMHETVIVTREIIYESRERLRAADRALRPR